MKRAKYSLRRRPALWSIIGSALLLCQCGVGAVNYTNANGNSAQSTGSTTSGSSTGSTVPTVSGVGLGLVVDPQSTSGKAHDVSSPDFYTQSLQTISAMSPSSDSVAIVKVGYNQSGVCILPFPASSLLDTITDSHISFSSSDELSALLTALDTQKTKVILELEPGYMPLTTLVTTVLTQYQTHTCVTGLAIDVSNYNTTSSASWATMDDSTAQSLVQTVQGINSAYKTYLVGTSSSMMPSTARDNLVFVDAQASFSSQTEALAAMQTWATDFSPASVAFIIGAQTDETWWCTQSNATANLFSAILASPASNLTGLFWSATSLDDILPSQTCGVSSSNSSTTTTGTTTGKTTAGTTTTTGTTTSGSTTATTTTTGTTTSGSTTAATTTTGSTTSGSTTATTTTGTTTSGSTTAATTTGTTTSGSTTATTTTTGTTTSGSTTATTTTTGTTTSGSTTAATTTTGTTTSGSTTATTTTGSTTSGSTTAATTTGTTTTTGGASSSSSGTTTGTR